MVKQKKLSRKERAENLISKWAFGILFALCIQFLVYILILNLVPTMVSKDNATVEEFVSAQYTSISNNSSEDGAIWQEYVANGYGENNTTVPVLNSFYKTDNYYTTNGVFKTSIENPTMFIYYYNMFLLVATIILIIYYFVNFMESNDGRAMKKIKNFLKEQWPFTILLVFMLWVFISSLFAGDYYRSFIGCFNLKDGYLSFLMYGAMLICSILLIKNNEKYKKIIVNTFLITATILAGITLWNYHYFTSLPKDFKNTLYVSIKDDAYEDEKIEENEVTANYILTSGNDLSNTVVTLGELIFGNGGLPKGEKFLIVTKRILGENNSGIFHNSNHYGYYLSICVIVAAVMFMKQSLKNKDGNIDIKNILLSVCYLISYIIMLKMAILNNTLGAYLGIGASIIFMLIYSLIPKNNKITLKEFVAVVMIIGIFVLLSATTVNAYNENIVYKNFSGLANDFKTLISANDNENNNISDSENGSNSDISGSASSVENEEQEEESAADSIGSGRGILWEKAAIMALQRPLFGYGLENILYEYNRQFGISEGRSHNLVLQLAATTGIVGMLLYVVGIASIWIRKLKYIKEWDVYECLGMFVIVSYIISSLVGNSAFYSSGYFYIFVGFVLFSYPKQDENLIAKNKKSIK